MTELLEHPQLTPIEPKTIEKVAIPGMSWLATKMMERQMEKIDIPPIPEFIELIGDSGARLYACKATVDMFDLTMEDFVPQVEDIISVGEFYERAGGGQVIFT